MGRLLRIKSLTFLFLVTCLLGIGLLPILLMLWKSLVVNGQIDLAHYRMLVSPRNWLLLKQSLFLSLSTTMLATAAGVPLGLLLSRTDLPLRRLFAALFTVPLLLPPYIIAFCWSILAARDGILAQSFGPTAAEAFSGWFFGFPGCVLTLFSNFLPIVMLLTMTYVKTINPHLEEAAKISAAWPTALRKITIPLIRPGILLAAMLVFLLTLGEFSVPMFFRYDVFPVESFVQFSAFYSFDSATAAAIPLALITFLALLAEKSFLLEKTFQPRPVPGEGALLIPLKRSRRWLFPMVFFFALLIVGLPLCVLLLSSGSFPVYAQAFSKAGASLGRSVLYAGIGASLLAFFGFLFGYLIHNKGLRYWRAIDTLTIFFFALPSPVIGIGLISLWDRPATDFIYGTWVMILLGYMIQFTALTSRITVAALAQIPPSMEEAAQIAGAGWVRRLAWIVAPLARRGLAAAWLVGYLFCLRDTGMTMMVYPPGMDTFPVRTFTLMANSPTQLIAALCVIMIGVILIPLGVLAFFRKRES
jgi:iron(III) transport system permease protein